MTTNGKMTNTKTTPEYKNVDEEDKELEWRFEIGTNHKEIFCEANNSDFRGLMGRTNPKPRRGLLGSQPLLLTNKQCILIVTI
ncbi:unnamed protein product [Cochlearia groenlandica]